MITWRRSVGDLAVYVTNPDETLFAADARQMADEVLKLAFDFARAVALVIQDRAKNAIGNNQPEMAPSPEKTPEPETTTGIPVIDALRARRDQVQTTLVQLNAQQKDLQNKLSRAAAKNRTTMSGEIVAIQAQIELAQSRLESLNAMIDFESSTAQKSGSPTALEAQIDELERSIPQTKAANVPASRSVNSIDAAASAGIVGRLELLLSLARKAQTLSSAIDNTHKLSQIGHRIA